VPRNMGMDHVGVVVPNAQEATDFFMDVFDCDFDWEVRRTPLPNAGERGWDRIFDIHPLSHLPHVWFTTE
jgi:catechol 2,3-dioxygenase-like lactoylglutathione lyase family enzyme